MAEEEDQIVMGDEDDEEGVDPFEYLGSMLQTDDGTSIAEVLGKISTQLENQNKILIKILSALTAAKSG